MPQNPAQKAADEALKVAKALSNLLNLLAGLEFRKEIAVAAGLTNVPDMLDRLYSLSDAYRAGGVHPVGQPMSLPQSDVAVKQSSYDGWDPERLRCHEGL